MCLAVPGRIVNIVAGSGPARTARVDFGGLVREVNVACVPDAVEGDFVLVHAGVAIGRLDESEALATLDLLKKIADSSREADCDS